MNSNGWCKQQSQIVCPYCLCLEDRGLVVLLQQACELGSGTSWKPACLKIRSGLFTSLHLSKRSSCDPSASAHGCIYTYIRHTHIQIYSHLLSSVIAKQFRSAKTHMLCAEKASVLLYVLCIMKPWPNVFDFSSNWCLTVDFLRSFVNCNRI